MVPVRPIRWLIAAEDKSIETNTESLISHLLVTRPASDCWNYSESPFITVKPLEPTERNILLTIRLPPLLFSLFSIHPCSSRSVAALLFAVFYGTKDLHCAWMIIFSVISFTLTVLVSFCLFSANNLRAKQKIILWKASVKRAHLYLRFSQTLLAFTRAEISMLSSRRGASPTVSPLATFQNPTELYLIHPRNIVQLATCLSMWCQDIITCRTCSRRCALEWSAC